MKGDLNVPTTHILKLQNCSHLIAAEWLKKIESCGKLTMPRTEARKLAYKMTCMAISSLFAASPNENERKRIGKQLAMLNYNQPEVISQTFSVLTEQMTKGLLPKMVAGLLPRFNHFLGQVTLGYIEESQRLLAEQKRTDSRAAVNASYIQKLTFHW